MFMRRVLVFVVPVLALIIGISSAFFLNSAPTDESTKISSPSSNVSANENSTPHSQIPMPVLDVPTLEPDPAWWQGSAPPGSIGVVWVSKEGSDPSNLFTANVQKTIYEDLSSCFPKNATNEDLFEAKVSCFDEKVIKIAASTPNPVDVFVSINALNVARPDVFTVCHNASHRVGEVALKRVHKVHGLDKEIIAALLDRGGSACMGGLMHGVMDAVANLVVNVEDYKPAIEACLLANPDTLGYCTDAVGHATWDTFRKVLPAAEVCSFFQTPSSRRECGEGILMRMYQREETTDSWYLGNTSDEDLPRWNKGVADICASWPKTPFAAAPEEDPREWCWSGSVYLLFKPIFAVMEEKVNQDKDQFEGISTRLSAAISVCQGFPAPGDDRCLERMGPSVGHIAGFEKEPAKQLCLLFPTQAAIERCTKDALSRIDDAYGS